jgi:hypothetical protein
VTFELVKDAVKLALIVAFLYVALSVYLGWKRPAWTTFPEKRRFGILLSLVLAVVGIKVSEDVLAYRTIRGGHNQRLSQGSVAACDKHGSGASLRQAAL